MSFAQWPTTIKLAYYLLLQIAHCSHRSTAGLARWLHLCKQYKQIGFRFFSIFLSADIASLLFANCSVVTKNSCLPIFLFVFGHVRVAGYTSFLRVQANAFPKRSAGEINICLLKNGNNNVLLNYYLRKYLTYCHNQLCCYILYVVMLQTHVQSTACTVKDDMRSSTLPKAAETHTFMPFFTSRGCTQWTRTKI